MTNPPWQRSKSKQIISSHEKEVWRAGNLVWLRAAKIATKPLDFGFKWCEKWGAWWLKHEPEEPLPDLVCFRVELGRHYNSVGKRTHAKHTAEVLKIESYIEPEPELVYSEPTEFVTPF